MSELVLIGLASAAIFVLAGGAQAVTGFAVALVAVPLLSLVVPPVPDVVGTVAVSLVITAIGWARERSHVHVEITRRLLLTALIGMPVGLLILRVLDKRALSLLIGVVVLVLAAALAFKMRLPAGRWAQRVAGGLSGALLTSTSINGPPLVLVLHGAGLSPRTFRATLQAVFCTQDLVALVAFALLGYVDPLAGAVAVGGWIGVPLGWELGDRVFRRLSPGVFQRVVIFGLMATGVVAMLKALI